jgi:uncharacterized protein (TIGR03067 family)
MKTQALLTSLALALIVAGCSKPHKSDAPTLQGVWINADGSPYPNLVLEGTNFKFQDRNSNQWYQATFSVREDAAPKQLEGVVTGCFLPQYVGKTFHAIYKIDGDNLTLVASEPGSSAAPTGFDLHGNKDLSEFEFIRKK